MSVGSLRRIFVNNRAEQFPDDVSGIFVIPLHFEKLDLSDDRKSVLIEGGRGCGKTMFIRHFCHSTVFSQKKEAIDDHEFGRIGLYWKPDVKFCKFLSKDGWIPEKYQDLAFQHLVALSILEDFSKSINSIERAKLKFGPIEISNVPISSDLDVYFGGAVSTVGEISKFVRTERAKFNVWTKNPRSDAPVFLQFDEILSRVLDEVASSNSRLQGIFVRIFIDEFENLQEAQQRLLNDHIKQPGTRFSVNIATRRNSSISTETSGFERIVEVHDYRRVDLEKEYLMPKGRAAFSLLAAEVLLLRLDQGGISLGAEFDFNVLHDKSRLNERKTDSYQNSIKSAARQIFPQITSKEIAHLVFNDKPLFRRLKKLVEKGLKKHSADRMFSTDEFLIESIPEASIVGACILNRDRTDPVFLHSELMKASEGKSSKFSSEGDWIQANLYGGLFYLYSGLPKRPCLLYSGFDRFCQIARSNLRFFQELCHESLTIYEAETDTCPKDLKNLVISPDIQASASRFASENVLLGVRQLGVHGPELLNMVRNMGKLFQLSQKRPGQSEPEVNHFSIYGQIPENKRNKIENILREARIWSVLYEDRDTKNKGEDDTESVEYFPNPIFTPYLGISYRKKRKITISAQDFIDIVEGDEVGFQRIWTEFEKRWSLASGEQQQGLFDV